MSAANAVPTTLGGAPAGYGRSCTNCARAKCKCILRSEGGPCERCHRLGKDCHKSATSRRRIGKKATASRTAQLEEKLDDLVSILRASQHPNQQISLSSTSSPNSSFPSRLDSLATAATSSSSQGQPDVIPQNPYNTGPCIPQHSALDINETFRLPEPTSEEAEVYLTKFRDWLKNFPFVVIPPTQTAAALREERPFLWLCIMNLTTMSAPQNNILRERIRHEYITRAFVNQERTMDLLLGLIAFLGWYVPRCSVPVHSAYN